MEIIKNLFKESYELIKNNFVLVQPLLLFFIVSGLLMKLVGEAFTLKSSIVTALSIGLLWTVFNAGWFNMINQCVKTPYNNDLPKAERALNSLKLFKEFFPGVTVFFIPILLGSIIYLILISLIIAVFYYIGISFIGIPNGLVWDEIFKAGQSNTAMYAYISRFPQSTIKQIAEWELLIIIALIVNYLLSYIFMFWGQCIVVNESNPINAYIQSVKIVIKHPILTLAINISSAISLNITLFLSIIPMELVRFVGLILYILVMVYFTLMTFLYIEKQNNNNNSWSNSDRQN